VAVGSLTGVRHDVLLADEGAVAAGTDRIAWAMLVASGHRSPRKEWSENANEWVDRAEGVFEAAVRAAVANRIGPSTLAGDGQR
jgi:hypothetical protein